MTRLPHRLLFVLSLVGLPAGLSCAHDKAAQKAPEKEMADLSSKAESFWRAVRWSDPVGASTAVEDVEQRRTWLSVMGAEMEAERYMDASLIDIGLGAPDPDPAATRLQPGWVKIQVQSYTMPAQVLKTRVVTQRWVRTHGGWFLDWDGGDPFALEPQPR